MPKILSEWHNNGLYVVEKPDKEHMKHSRIGESDCQGSECPWWKDIAKRSIKFQRNNNWLCFGQIVPGKGPEM